MMKVDFKEIMGLTSNSEIQFIEEIKDQIHGLIKIESVFVRETAALFDIYSTRYKIQQEITKNDRIEGWETLISNLEDMSKYADSLTKFTMLICEQFGYAIFSTPDNLRVFGILKFKDLKVSKEVELDNFENLKGTWTDAQFFYEGKELK